MKSGEVLQAGILRYPLPSRFNHREEIRYLRNKIRALSDMDKIVGNQLSFRLNGRI